MNQPHNELKNEKVMCCIACHADEPQIGVNGGNPWCALQGQCICHFSTPEPKKCEYHPVGVLCNYCGSSP